MSFGDSPCAAWEVSAAMKWACAPSWVAPASNELRVRVDLSKKNRNTVLSGRYRVGFPALKAAFRPAEVVRSSSSSSSLQSRVSM